METAAARIACECGKSYKWKPKLAGKAGQCPCGRRVDFPLEAPVEELPDDDAPFMAATEEPVAPTRPAPSVRSPASRLATAPAKAKATAPTALNWSGSLWFWVGGLACVGVAIWQIVDPHDPAEEGGRRRSFLRAIEQFAYNIGGQWGVVAVCLLGALICFGLAYHTLKSPASDD